MSGSAPLIVTAELPPAVASWATDLRRTHYPPERNVLPAHVTLFHALPPSALAEARGLLAALCADYAPIEARMTRVISLGSGTALMIDSPLMLAVRGRIAEHFHGMLIAQDSPVPRLHITIQNKVTPAQAKALQTELAAHFNPRDFCFKGLALHHYRGGPWEGAGVWKFRR